MVEDSLGTDQSRQCQSSYQESGYILAALRQTLKYPHLDGNAQKEEPDLIT